MQFTLPKKRILLSFSQFFEKINIPRFFLILTFLVTQYCIAQNKNYDDMVYQAIVRKAGKDINGAMKMADSLYKATEDPLKQVKSLMLLAELNLNTGNKKEGMNYAFTAKRITVENSLFEWEARIYGFIASHYRSIGLKKQSKIYISKGLEAIKNVKDIHIVNQYKGLAYQEFALYETENKNYKKAIDYLKVAGPCFNYVRNEDLKQYQFAVNHGMFGRAYMYLKDTESAVAHFRKALDYLAKIKNEATVVKGFMFEGIGRAYLENNDMREALAYLNKALKVSDQSNDLELQLDVYCDLAIYYMESGNITEYKRYNDLYLATLKKITEANKDSSEIVVNRLQEREDELSRKHLWTIVGFAVTAIALILIIVMIRSKRIKEYRKFSEIINNIQKNKEAEYIEKTIIAVEDEANGKEITEKELMSKDVESLILAKLQNFENGSDFTSKSITLSSLSVMLETNSKYLSYVINKHKKKDFNNYINELRIFYIIKKLESSPEYLNYKISYLAEECGFSSHSKFTDKFKMVTDMSPSTFIGFLKKETKDQVA